MSSDPGRDVDHREWGEPPSDPHDVDLAVGAIEVLRPFNRAGLLLPADIYTAQRLASLAREPRPEVVLAAALTVRALRQGSVCLDLAQLVPDQFAVAATTDAEGTPSATEVGVEPITLESLRLDPAGMLAALADSPMVTKATAAEHGSAPLLLSGSALYLAKYHQQEELVAAALDVRAHQGRNRLLHEENSVDDQVLAVLNRVMGSQEEARQRLATLLARHWPLVVVAGGPGTGKTTTVARLLAVLAADAQAAGRRRPRVALAAPTGKAAARLSEAVTLAVAQLPPEDRGGLGQLRAHTLHRLLGGRPGGTFTRNASHPLAEDIVVVDETSMVSLSMMARLLDAVDEHTRLVLVGDPDQLASVEAGAVLADIVARANSTELTDEVGAAVRELAEHAGVEVNDRLKRLAAQGIVELNHRFRFEGPIAELADAIVEAQPANALRLLRQPVEQQTGASRVRLVELPEELEPAVTLATATRNDSLHDIKQRCLDSALAMRAAAVAGDGPAALLAMREHQLLTAHRSGPFGVKWWQRQVEGWLSADGSPPPAGVDDGPWFLGRPVMATTNDRDLGVFNGDTGVVIDHPARGRVVVFGSPTHPILVPPARLGPVDIVNALTIHKSQGSQYRHVSLILPPASSPLLTRELLYTAVTRAEQEVLVVGTASSVEQAIARPVRRASGLRTRRQVNPGNPGTELNERH